MTSIALLLDDRIIQKWQYNALCYLIENADVEVGTAIINKKGNKQNIIKMATQGPISWKAYSAGRRLLWRFDGPPWYRERKPLPGDWNHKFVRPLSADGIGNKLPQSGIDILREHDIAIRFGFGILKGDALTAPKYGVLSYHHGDIREYRGKPAGFWENLNGENKVGITVQRLSEELDAGAIASFDTVEISDTNSWPKILDRLFAASPPLLLEAVESIVGKNGVNHADQIGDLYSTPELRDLLQYFRLRWTG